MKRYIRASLFSAFTPGLGQFINHRYFKGAIHMAAFNLVILALIILLVADFLTLWSRISVDSPPTWSVISAHFEDRGLLSYGILTLVGAVVWILSILDAYRDGKLPLPDSRPRG